MARILITGSTTGLGAAAARELVDRGHEVVLHARNGERARDIPDLAQRSVSLVVGDLAGVEQIRGLAEQANDIGGIDAVIHNAGIYVGLLHDPVTGWVWGQAA
ncbi:MAG: SDR family NAD(P)-dependent oxidoreductase [Microthrixaceae bacterium]